MTDYLHPGKTTTGQYYAEPTFKLLDVMKQKHWRKLSVKSLTFFMTVHHSTNTVVAQQALRDCKFVQLNHPVCSPDSAPSDYFLIRNRKYHLRGTWFTDYDSLMTAVEAWFECQNRKFYFQGINSWEEKLKKCTDVTGEYVETWQYTRYNTLIFIARLHNVFDRPSYLAKLQARAWLSHALGVPGQHTANRRRKCTRQSRFCW